MDFVAAWQCKTAHCSRNNWSSGDAEVWGSLPSALQRLAISIPFLTSRGISRGLVSPQMMKWSKLWRRGSNKELLNSSLTACVNLFYFGKKCIERQGDYVEKEICQFVAKILYFTSYFRLFKYMVSFSRYFTVCITYQPPFVNTLGSQCVHSILWLNRLK